MPYGTPNPLTQLAPKAPSKLHNLVRWSFLVGGVFYGAWRLENLKKKSAEIVPKEKQILEYMRAKRKFIEERDTNLSMIALKKECEGTLDA